MRIRAKDEPAQEFLPRVQGKFCPDDGREESHGRIDGGIVKYT